MPDSWILFDLDGTVLEYDAASHRCLAATFAWLGMEADAWLHEAFQRINADHWERYERGEQSHHELRLRRWREFLAEHDHDADPVMASEHYLALLAQTGDLVDGAVEVLAALARDHRLGAITNGFGDVQRPRLAASGLDRFFEFVVVSEEAGASKPDPLIFDAAFAAMGHPPMAAVTLVGDSLAADVAGGVAYGINTIWFNPTGAPLVDGLRPDRVIRRLDELLDGALDRRPA